jgi:Domain of unknown function (DUF5664)
VRLGRGELTNGSQRKVGVMRVRGYGEPAWPSRLGCAVDPAVPLRPAGAEKYGRRNWQLARTEAELERFKASAFRHLVQWLQGDTEEAHAAAVCFNVMACELHQSTNPGGHHR